MKFDFEAQHRARREHITADVLSQLSAGEKSKFDIGIDILVYGADDVYPVTDISVKKKVASLTVPSHLSTQREDTNCGQLAKYADAPNSPFLL